MGTDLDGICSVLLWDMFCLVISVLVLKMVKSWECFIEVQKVSRCIMC